MSTNIKEGIVSKEFLENSLGRKINSITVALATNVGDNYCSTIYSIDVEVFEKDSTDCETNKTSDDKKHLHLISKCYPVNPKTQEFVNSMNMFWKELTFYQQFVPKLLQMQENIVAREEIIQPIVPHFVAGHAIDFNSEIDAPKKHYVLFDNCVIMTDYRETYGFKMTDRLKSFDRNHASLVVAAMATNNALSWVYQKKYKLSKITEHFPIFENQQEANQNVWQALSVGHGRLICSVMESVLGKESPVVIATKKFVDNTVAEIITIQFGSEESKGKMLEKHFRVKPQSETLDDEIPWIVLVQTDCWSSNMLFRYNSDLPEEVIILDYQFCRESCPTTDLAYMFYNSTDIEFRKNHLDEMLNIYVNAFNKCCKILKSETLPNFSLQELKRRFHRSKIYGLCVAFASMPTILIPRDHSGDNTKGEEMSFDESIKAMFQNAGSSKIFLDRIIGLCTEMYEDGVI